MKPQHVRPTRIKLISNYLPDDQQSMRRYASLLHRIASSAGYDVETVRAPAILGRLPWPTSALRKWIGYIDKFIIGPPVLRWKIRTADIVHICDHSNAMYLKLVGSKPALITCHDLIAVFSAMGRYKGVHVGRTGRLLQKWIALSLASAQHVVCVSQKTAIDLCELAPDMKSSLLIIHNPLNWNFRPAPRDQVQLVLEHLHLPSDVQYLLHVGGNQWYKNRLSVMQIWSQLVQMPEFERFRLVMAGKPWTRQMREFHALSNFGDRVVEATGLENELLRALYTGATALLFPSLEEGFGWPILEAQACGCPVITTNRAPMTEVAGDAAILIDPSNAVEAAKQICDQWPRVPGLREAGFRNVSRFAESGAATAYIAAYEMLLRAR
jgi:glycosyltransferase involved in cell wall biosynthesis